MSKGRMVLLLACSELLMMVLVHSEQQLSLYL
jgi:hypothetical protein